MGRGVLGRVPVTDGDAVRDEDTDSDCEAVRVPEGVPLGLAVAVGVELPEVVAPGVPGTEPVAVGLTWVPVVVGVTGVGVALAVTATST